MRLRFIYSLLRRRRVASAAKWLFVSLLCSIGGILAWQANVFRANLQFSQRIIAEELADRGWTLVALEEPVFWRKYILNRFSEESPLPFTHATIGNYDCPTNRDLEMLSCIPSLREVFIVSFESKVDDAGLRALVRLPDLEVLFLANSHITDRGIRGISKCAHLHTLVIDGRRITAESVNYFRECPSLRHLTINDTQLSLPERDRLREAIPACRVLFWDSKARKFQDTEAPVDRGFSAYRFRSWAGQEYAVPVAGQELS